MNVQKILVFVIKQVTNLNKYLRAMIKLLGIKNKESKEIKELFYHPSV